MRANKRLTALAGCAVLAGCAGTVPVVDYYESDSETLRRYIAIEIIADQTGFSAIEPVRGLYCNRGANDTGIGSPAARAQAVDQVKLKAAKLRADAMTEPSCSANAAMDLANNCWSSLICEAVALKREAK